MALHGSQGESRSLPRLDRSVWRVTGLTVTRSEFEVTTGVLRNGSRQVRLGISRRLRQAHRDQRTSVTLTGLVFGRRRSDLIEKTMEPLRSFFGCSAEFFVKDHVTPAPPGPIEEIAAGDAYVEHLLQTQGLCTQLYFVCTMALRAAALVLNRSWRPMALAPVKRYARSAPDPSELDHISPARQAQLHRAHR